MECLMTTQKNPLKLLEDYGQSVWLDYVRRSLIASGGLAAMVETDGLKGVTSNPAIFEKAIGGSSDYDEDFAKFVSAGDRTPGEIYEHLAIGDIRAAADVLKPVYEATGGVDGYISLEVSPYLAMDTEGTIAEARRLWQAVDRPNLMIKVPGTEAGVPAIRTLIGEGHNINVTLLFSQDAYRAVAEAYIAGLEELLARGGDVSRVASVASFFVSRIDTAIDARIDQRIAAGDPQADALAAIKGKVAIANAKMAYQYYLSLLETPRWRKLADAGARPQRLLWASTGTKNKAYSDILYVTELIGRDTVNTVPPATMDAFRDHGAPRETLTAGIDEARAVLEATERLGLDLDGVTRELVVDGVRQFADAFDQLLGAVAAKRRANLGNRLNPLTANLPPEMATAVEGWIEKARNEAVSRRIWARDASLWTGSDEAKWLGWLDIAAREQANIDRLKSLQAEIRGHGYRHALLLGMGGSSLGPEVLARTFGQQPGYPELLVLDSTDPQQIARFEARIDLASTVFIVSSKSGSTLEPNILKAYFFDRVARAIGTDRAGERFIAVTDPGSSLEKVAAQDHFRHVFHGDPAIGGRYSVLSNFGLVPAAVMGLDLDRFLAETAIMVDSCGPDVPPAEHPGIELGAILGLGATSGRDKVTVIASPAIADIGAWLEQLLAESTGKQGRGIIPVDAEPLGAPQAYGNDRIFAYLRLCGEADTAQDTAVAALQKAGQPVIRIELADRYRIGQEFFRWEIATAIAGSIIGINAFNQPDVEASKVVTRQLTDAYATSGALPAETPLLVEDGIALFADDRNAAELAKAAGEKSLDAYVRAHLARCTPGDYAGLLAYIDHNAENEAQLARLRTLIRDRLKVATCVGFGPRFLHSTGQAYKGGPNSGVFTQITADAASDLPVPDHGFSFGVVILAQARGDFAVLAERKRRALRVHLGKDVRAGLERFGKAIERALS